MLLWLFIYSGEMPQPKPQPKPASPSTYRGEAFVPASHAENCSEETVGLTLLIVTLHLICLGGAKQPNLLPFIVERGSVQFVQRAAMARGIQYVYLAYRAITALTTLPTGARKLFLLRIVWLQSWGCAQIE